MRRLFHIPSLVLVLFVSAHLLQGSGVWIWWGSPTRFPTTTGRPGSIPHRLVAAWAGLAEGMWDHVAVQGEPRVPRWEHSCLQPASVGLC